MKSIAVITPGFSADCLETLEEIAFENAEIFKHNGGEHFAAIPCLNDSAPGMQVIRQLDRARARGLGLAVCGLTRRALVARQRVRSDEIEQFVRHDSVCSRPHLRRAALRERGCQSFHEHASANMRTPSSRQRPSP